MPVIMITGCSSGIGRAVALAAVGRGFTTVATSRDTAALVGLAERGCAVHRLDVTDPGERERVVAEVTGAYGGVDALVNNAGYAEFGPFEDVPLDRWEAQFATNVFGVVGLTQLVLPGMRARGHGRIVNVSSLAGELVLPMGAAYHASKYALEGATEALRLEVRRFGVDVSLVQPGAVNSRFARNIPDLGRYADGPYEKTLAEIRHQLLTRTARGVAPDRVASAVLRAVTAGRPRARYRVGFEAHALLALRRALPDELWARCVAVLFPSLRGSADARR